MIDLSRTINLFFWFSWLFSIVTIFSSAISLFIFEKRVITFSSFIKFFIVNNRSFNIFIVFLKSSKTIENWITFFAILTIFFAKAETFEYIFFLNFARSLLIRINSKNKNAIKVDVSFLWKEKEEKTTKVEKICRLLKSTKEKSKRFKALDIIEFENSATEFFEAKKKVSKITETVLTIFFIDLIVFFFDWMIFFIATKATSEFEQFVTFRSNTEQSAHRLSSKTKNWTYIQFFFSDSTNRKFHRFDCSNYMCFESSWNESRCARSTADIRIRFRQDQIIFEISQAFVFYIFANIDVFKHIIDVDDCFSSSRHWKRKKNKKKKKKRFFDFLEIEQIIKNDEKRNSDDRRNWKKRKKRRIERKKKKNKTKQEKKKKKDDKNELKEKKTRKMIKMNKKIKKIIWKLIWMIKSAKKNDFFDDRRYDKERKFVILRKN